MEQIHHVIETKKKTHHNDEQKRNVIFSSFPYVIRIYQNIT